MRPGRRCLKLNCCAGAPGLPACAGVWSGIVIKSSSASRRILALWFPFLPADRLRRAPGGLAPEIPLALTSKVKGALRLVAVDQAARSLGLEQGIALADARTRVPMLEAVEHDEAADRAWIERLADGGNRCTPLVGPHVPECVVDSRH